MTAGEFKSWQESMGWTIQRTAQELRLQPRQIYLYRSGRSVVPASMQRLCELLELLHKDLPERVRKVLGG